MKKKFGYILGLLLAAAPLAFGQILFGPEVGITGNLLQQRAYGYEYYSTPTVGARVGFIADFPLSSHFSLQPSLAFVLSDGGRTNLKRHFKTGAGLPTTVTDERSYHANVIHAPIMFSYRTNATLNGHQFTFGIGPYASVAVGGRFIQDYTTILNGDERPNRYNRRLKKGDVVGEDDLRYWDYGASAAVGMELNSGLNVKVYYNYGIANRAPGTNTSQNDYRSMSAALTLSYFVNKPKPLRFR